MAQEPKIYGFSPRDWENMPQWLQTFITESNERAAAAHHAQHRNSVQSQWDQSWKSAELVLRTLITVEGGSVVAILAFLGVLAERESSLDVAPLILALGLIGAALVCAILSAFCAYLVSAYYGEAFERRSLSFDNPYVLETEASAKSWKIGGNIRIAGIILAFVSLIAMCGGVVAFGNFMQRALSRGGPELSTIDLVRAATQASSNDAPTKNPVIAPNEARSPQR